MKRRLRLADERGHTLAELVIVLAIITVVIAGITQLFVSASKSQIELTDRFEAQQESRLALDALRREIHCAKAVTPTTITSPGITTMTITLASSCPTNSTGADLAVTWCTIGSGSRWALWRTPGSTCTATGGIRKADYLTTSQVFTAYTAGGAGTGLRAKLSVLLPVDTKPAAGQVGCPTASKSCYDLKDDIVLRNTSRT